MTTSPPSPHEPTPDGGPISWVGHMANGVGHTFGLPPKSVLSATSSELSLSGPLGTFQLPRTSILRVGIGGMYPWFFSGIRIHHTHPGCPQELQFKAPDVPKRTLLAQLKALGYPVG